jgi:hypothetical protein
MFIEKTGTISSTPEGSYVFVEIVFLKRTIWDITGFRS